MPKDAIYVGRPSAWGNDFIVGKDGDRSQCIRLYREYFIKRTIQVYGMAYFEPLRGKDLACWCSEGDSCHADVLLELLAEMPCGNLFFASKT